MERLSPKISSLNLIEPLGSMTNLQELWRTGERARLHPGMLLAKPGLWETLQDK